MKRYGFTSNTGIVGVVLILLGLLLTMIAVIYALVVQASEEDQAVWVYWVFTIGCVLGILGGFLLAIVIRRHNKKLVQVRMCEELNSKRVMKNKMFPGVDMDENMKQALFSRPSTQLGFNSQSPLGQSPKTSINSLDPYSGHGNLGPPSLMNMKPGDQFEAYVDANGTIVPISKPLLNRAPMPQNGSMNAAKVAECHRKCDNQQPGIIDRLKAKLSS